MRIIAGALGGRRLVVPRGSATRPTTELVRGAVLNSLDARGAVLGAVVADLFAGTGALGLEALSRGARRAIFVESHARTARAIEANIAALGVASQASVIVDDAERWARGRRAGIDVVFADPPYGWSGWDGLLASLSRLDVALVVAESDRAVCADGWEVALGRCHGGTVVSLLQPRGATPL